MHDAASRWRAKEAREQTAGERPRDGEERLPGESFSPDRTYGGDTRLKKHIFACVRNASRSQMAAACVTVRARTHPAAGTRGACIIVTVLSGFLVIGFLIFGMFYQAWKEHQKRRQAWVTQQNTTVSSDLRGTTATDFTVGDVKLREPLDEVLRRLGRPQTAASGRDGDRELVYRKGALRVTVNREQLVTVVEARELKRKGKIVLRVGDPANLVVPLLGPTHEDHSTSLEYPAPQKTVAHENRSFRYHWGADQLSVETLDEKVSHIYVQALGSVTPLPAAPPPTRSSASGSPAASDWR